MKAVKLPALLIALAALVLAAGCKPHIKVVESFESTMTPNARASGKTVDPYTFGGTAGAAGGKNPQASYSPSR